MKNYLSNWDVMRFIRLALGVAIMIQGFVMKDWSFVFIGGAFSLMPIFNIGCCANSCKNKSTIRNKTQPKPIEETTYEEIH